MKCSVYKVYDSEKELLYVGCSVDPVERIRTHKKTDWGSQIATYHSQECSSQEEAALIEAELIATLSPKYNKSPGNYALGTVRNYDEEGRKPIGMLIRLPPTLRKKIRMEAAETDRSMNQVVVSALKAYFLAPKGQGPRRKK